MTARVLYMPGVTLHDRVITAAGGRCQCTGRCGSEHRKGEGRCVAEHQAGRPLRAVPRALDVSAAAAMQLAAGDLMALCPPCYDGAARRAAARPRPAPGTQGDLFGGAG